MKNRSKRRRPEGRETITGVLTPAGWDGDGNVTAVMLSANDDEEYLIENGAKFIDLVHRNIEADGIVHRDRKSFRTIDIRRFRVMEPPSPDKTDDGWLLEARGP